MKVVLFCGGLGLRMRKGAASPPKPLVPLAGRPLLRHVMAYDASAGHTDFVLCLGHRAAEIRRAVAHRHTGFWAPVDTPYDRLRLRLQPITSCRAAVAC